MGDMNDWGYNKDHRGYLDLIVKMIKYKATKNGDQFKSGIRSLMSSHKRKEKIVPKHVEQVTLPG